MPEELPRVTRLITTHAHATEHFAHVLAAHLLHESLQATHATHLLQHLWREGLGHLLDVQVLGQITHLSVLRHLQSLHLAPHLGQPLVLFQHVHHVPNLPTRPSSDPDDSRLSHQLWVCTVKLYKVDEGQDKFQNIFCFTKKKALD